MIDSFILRYLFGIIVLINCLIVCKNHYIRIISINNERFRTIGLKLNQNIYR
jgi:hypothetical protein